MQKLEFVANEEYIGEGAFGHVYRFKKAQKGKYLAVKKIFQHHLKTDISREKELLELVEHKHIIKYHYSYFEGPLLCIVMEYANK